MLLKRPLDFFPLEERLGTIHFCATMKSFTENVY